MYNNGEFIESFVNNRVTTARFSHAYTLQQSVATLSRAIYFSDSTTINVGSSVMDVFTEPILQVGVRVVFIASEVSVRFVREVASVDATARTITITEPVEEFATLSGDTIPNGSNRLLFVQNDGIDVPRLIGGSQLTPLTILAVLNAATGSIDADLLGNSPGGGTGSVEFGTASGEIATWAEGDNTAFIPETKIPVLTDAKIPAIPSTRITNFATDVNARIADWAETDNTDAIPETKIPVLTEPKIPVLTEPKIPVLTEPKIPLLTAAKIPQLATSKITGLEAFVDARITTIGDIVTYADEAAFTASDSTATTWNHGDVLILSDGPTTYLFTGIEEPPDRVVTLAADFHIITSTSSLTSLGITATAAELNQLDGVVPVLTTTDQTIAGDKTLTGQTIFPTENRSIRVGPTVSNGVVVIQTTASNVAALTLESTGDFSSSSNQPDLVFNTRGDNPPDETEIGELIFQAEDDSNVTTRYASVSSEIVDGTDALEKGLLKVTVLNDGDNVDFTFQPTGHLDLPATPTAANHAANMAYVDSVGIDIRTTTVPTTADLDTTTGLAEGHLIYLSVIQGTNRIGFYRFTRLTSTFVPVNGTGVTVAIGPANVALPGGAIGYDAEFNLYFNTTTADIQVSTLALTNPIEGIEINLSDGEVEHVIYDNQDILIRSSYLLNTQLDRPNDDIRFIHVDPTSNTMYLRTTNDASRDMLLRAQSASPTSGVRLRLAITTRGAGDDNGVFDFYLGSTSPQVPGTTNDFLFTIRGIFNVDGLVTATALPGISNFSNQYYISAGDITDAEISGLNNPSGRVFPARLPAVNFSRLTTDVVIELHLQDLIPTFGDFFTPLFDLPTTTILPPRSVGFDAAANIYRNTTTGFITLSTDALTTAVPGIAINRAAGGGGGGSFPSITDDTATGVVTLEPTIGATVTFSEVVDDIGAPSTLVGTNRDNLLPADTMFGVDDTSTPTAFISGDTIVFSDILSAGRYEIIGVGPIVLAETFTAPLNQVRSSVAPDAGSLTLPGQPATTQAVLSLNTAAGAISNITARDPRYIVSSILRVGTDLVEIVGFKAQSERGALLDGAMTDGTARTLVTNLPAVSATTGSFFWNNTTLVWATGITRTFISSDGGGHTFTDIPNGSNYVIASTTDRTQFMTGLIVNNAAAEDAPDAGGPRDTMEVTVTAFNGVPTGPIQIYWGPSLAGFVAAEGVGEPDVLYVRGANGVAITPGDLTAGENIELRLTEAGTVIGASEITVDRPVGVAIPSGSDIHTLGASPAGITIAGSPAVISANFQRVSSEINAPDLVLSNLPTVSTGRADSVYTQTGAQLGLGGVAAGMKFVIQT